MSSSGGKVITKLRERRQIEADLRRMLDVTSEIELQRQAREMAARGPEVIPAFIGSLDQAEGPMLAALGMVAAHLDRTEVVRALYRVLQQPGRSYRGRMGAVAILERFLGVPVTDDLRPGLAEAVAVAVSSLGEVLDRSEEDPSLLAGMVQSLDQQEPDVVLAVVWELRKMAGARPVELLRMTAQDVREEIAAEAVQALGGLRLPEAARALQTLIPIAPPSLRPVAERLLRKLHFTGVEVAPLPAVSPELRALAGPVDGQGQRFVWFIRDGPATAEARFLSVYVSDTAGAVEAVEHWRMHRRFLPPRRPVGTVHGIGDGTEELLLVEVPFDLGRRLIAEALELNRETQIPVAGVLRLAGHWLWGTELAGFPARVLPNLVTGDEALVAQSDQLVSHPAFAGWRPGRQAAATAAEEAIRHPAWDREVWVRRLAAEWMAEPEMALQLHRRLEANSEWLEWAGEWHWARLALVTARASRGEDPQQLPFVQELVRRELELALAGLMASRVPGPGRDSMEGES